MLDSTATTNRPVRNMPPMYGPDVTRDRLARQCARYTGEKVRIIPPNRLSARSTLVIGPRAVSVYVQDGRVTIYGYSGSQIAPYSIDHEFAVKKTSGKRDILDFLEVFNHPLTEALDGATVQRREVAHREEVEIQRLEAQKRSVAEKLAAGLMQEAENHGLRTDRILIRPGSSGLFTVVLSNLNFAQVALLFPHLK